MPVIKEGLKFVLNFMSVFIQCIIDTSETLSLFSQAVY